MAKKKIIIVGSDDTSALELVYARILKQNGYIVSIFGAQTLFYKYYYKSLKNKIIFRAGLSSIINKIQIDLKSVVLRENPDFALIFKGMEIKPKTLKWLKDLGVILINYNPDHPFIFSGKGSGNKNVLNSINYFDYYFSYANDAVLNLNNLGIRSSKISFGFDSEGFSYNELNMKDEIVKICFLGNADKYRVDFINSLSEYGLEIDVYGGNWDKFNMSSKVNVGSSQYGKDFWLTLQKYAIQLNLMRLHNLNTHNMRTFDIPGSGGIMLAPRTLDHCEYFCDGEEVFLFESLESAVNVARKILEMSFEARLIIRRNARRRALENYTYSHRINQMMKIIEK